VGKKEIRKNEEIKLNERRKTRTGKGKERNSK
jgi:hypothetical protein